MGRAREEDSPGGGNVSEADKRGAEIGYSLSRLIYSKMRTFWGVLIFDFQAVDTLSTASKMRTFWGVLIFDFQAVDTLSTACAGQLPLPGLFLIVPRPRAADSRPYGETCIPRRRGAYYAPAMSDPVPCPTGEDKPRPCDVVPSAAKNPAPAARSAEHCSAFSLRRPMVGATERRSPFTVGARITRPPCLTL